MCCFSCHTYPPTFNFGLLIPGLTFSGPQRRNTKRQRGRDEWRGRKKGRERREEERRHKREGNMETQINRERGAKGVVWRTLKEYMLRSIKVTKSRFQPSQKTT